MRHENACRNPFLTCALITMTLAVLLPPRAVASQEIVPGRYIVVLKRDAAMRELGVGPRVAEVATNLSHRFGGQIRKEFRRALPGYVLEADERAVRELRKDPRVASVLPDTKIRVAAVQPSPPSWGLDRIDQRSTSLDETFVYFSDSRDVHIYFVDTGIRSTHLDFTGRVDTLEAFSVVDDGFGTEDCFGHGTMVAGIAAGEAHGVAKAAILHPVKVFDCDGVGYVSGILEALDWILTSYRAPAVINMSLGSGAHAALDAAVRSVVAAGIPVVVAAGNSGLDACNYSPARVQEAITVGASDAADQLASYSNRGVCVDLVAPGNGLVTTGNLSDEAQAQAWGTSFATPHVTGAVAQYLSLNPEASSEEVHWAILASSTAVAGANGESHLLAYAAFGDPGLDLAPFAAVEVSCWGMRCLLDGRGSFDDIAIAGWEWNIGDGTWIISGKKRNKLRFTFPDDTLAVSVKLTVTDTAGQKASRAIAIRFNETP